MTLPQLPDPEALEALAANLEAKGVRAAINAAEEGALEVASVWLHDARAFFQVADYLNTLAARDAEK